MTYYLLTTAPVADHIIRAATETGVSIVAPRLSVDGTQALVTFGDDVAGYDLLTAAEARHFLTANAADWEAPDDDYKNLPATGTTEGQTT